MQCVGRISTLIFEKRVFPVTGSTSSMDVIVLCGGFGTRLKLGENDPPKPMVLFKGRPFLDILIDYVNQFGFSRFIFCTGFKGDWIEAYYETKKDDRTYLFSRETKALGTAGAIRLATRYIESDTLLVVNGDSFCKIDLEKMLDFHIGKKSDISVALIQESSSNEYGVINLEEDGRIICFHNKSAIVDKGLVNAGIYYVSRKVLEKIPEGKELSLEHDVFPKFSGNNFYGYRTDQCLYDIGTPERLEFARKDLA